jgi:DNA-binding IclR family transcriptional regulator
MSLLGQRRRYAVVGVLAARGPCTVAQVARLARMPRWVVRRDLVKAERGGWVRRTPNQPGDVLEHWEAGPRCWGLRQSGGDA